MKYSSFTYYNLVSGVIWVVSMLLIGFYLGRVIPDVDKHIEKVIVVIVFLSLLPAIIKYIKHKFQKKEAAVERAD